MYLCYTHAIGVIRVPEAVQEVAHHPAETLLSDMIAATSATEIPVLLLQPPVRRRSVIGEVPREAQVGIN